MANTQGQAFLTRSNPLVCHLVVIQSQGYKIIPTQVNVKGRRSRDHAARLSGTLVTPATSLPVTRTLARQVVSRIIAHEHSREGFRD